MSKEIERLPNSFTKDGHTYTLNGDRIIRDGIQVAVLISPGFGAGFTTWNDISPFQPAIVTAILLDRIDLVENATPQELGVMGDEYAFLGGVKDLTIEWVTIVGRDLRSQNMTVVNI
jgi:hypothetical protein